MSDQFTRQIDRAIDADSARPADAYAAYCRHADRGAAAAADPRAMWNALGGAPQ